MLTARFLMVHTVQIAGTVAGQGCRGTARAGGQGSPSLPGVLQHSRKRAQPCCHFPGIPSASDGLTAYAENTNAEHVSI